MSGLLLMKASKVKVFDGFNRANNALALDNADTGQGWQAILGSWGVFEGNAYTSIKTIAGRAILDAGIADCFIQCTFPVVIIDEIYEDYTRQGLICRSTDNENEITIRFNNTKLYLDKRVMGILTTIAEASVTIVDGVNISVLLKGENIKIYSNSILVIDYNLDFNVNATKHGLYSNHSTAPRFDNFKVVSI